MNNSPRKRKETTPQVPQATHALTLNIAARRQFSTEHLLQNLIDEAPATHRELLAYALFYGYLSVRLPGIPLSPDPPELATLRPGHKRYIAINDGIQIFDFAPPTLRPRATLFDALRSKHACIYIFTQPLLIKTWESRVAAWPPKIRNRIEVRTVPSWIDTGFGLMSFFNRRASRACLKKLIQLTNHCLRQIPSTPFKIVAVSRGLAPDMKLP
jgi:hypothetical protein